MCLSSDVGLYRIWNGVLQQVQTALSKKVSRERMGVELDKMFSGEKPFGTLEQSRYKLYMKICPWHCLRQVERGRGENRKGSRHRRYLLSWSQLGTENATHPREALSFVSRSDITVGIVLGAQVHCQTVFKCKGPFWCREGFSWSNEEPREFLPL